MNKPLHCSRDPLEAPAPSTSGSPLFEQLTRRALELTQSLQTSLDPARLIEIFSIEAGALIRHQGIRYRNDAIRMDAQFGQQARHSCSYELHIGDQSLGKLTLHRQQKFQETEIEALEQLLCSLLYPLRNALLYQDALQLAQKDPLTGICNRAALDEMMQREVSHARRKGANCALCLIDIDHFKTVNDKYGHIIGDCALKAIASMMAACKRDGDLLFRYGGEEFVVLLRDTGMQGARRLAERIRSHIQDHACQCPGTALDLTVSIGVSLLRAKDSPASLFARADQALYSAKRQGRNQVCMEAKVP